MRDATLKVKRPAAVEKTASVLALANRFSGITPLRIEYGSLLPQDLSKRRTALVVIGFSIPCTLSYNVNLDPSAWHHARIQILRMCPRCAVDAEIDDPASIVSLTFQP